ncbi:MAG TPA: plastocyanin/azurin family copper-binding protein [Longimicrobium sp.]|nr:plastocyanin/azurin family copper-binding protein [Longimicrobium sp.]
MQARTRLSTAALAAALALSACGSETSAAAVAKGDSAHPRAAAPAVAPPAGRMALGRSTEPSGRVIEIQMVTDELGNRFEPDTVRAREHDVLKFVLVTGVHNVSFPADRNAGVQGLPGPSELLQGPGQAREYVVGLNAGSYFFQCDPHAALGMAGTLIVE